MTLTDLYYAAVGNPVCQAIKHATAALFRIGTASDTKAALMKASAENTSKIVSGIMPPMWKLAGRNHTFVQLAGLSGATAMLLGTIGHHLINSNSDKGDAKKKFDIANRFHFINSLALLAVPLAKYPAVTGGLMSTGTVLFCGTLYMSAFWNRKHMELLAPVGSTMLVLAWLSLLI